MREASKSFASWPLKDRRILERYSEILDIGAGDDLIVPHAQRFDRQEGDAEDVCGSVMLRGKQFDVVFSSHCLEHLENPYRSFQDWWGLVRPGGWMIVLVPDEDLYEQGYWPSRFNPDHKHTFTMMKLRSWSPTSVNVMRMVRTLVDVDFEVMRLNDTGYDRNLRGIDQTRGDALAQIEIFLKKK